MVSEFRRKKFLELFSYYDTEKTGVIEKKGFEAAVKEVAKAKGFQEGDVNYKQTEDILLKVWDGIQKAADKDGDGKVSDEEWIAMWDKYPSESYDWQTLYAKWAFSLLDETNDGKVDSNEFCKVNESFGIPKDTSATAFQKISKGKATISWDDYYELWKEFFTTEDPNAACNYIFGTVSS